MESDIDCDEETAQSRDGDSYINQEEVKSLGNVLQNGVRRYSSENKLKKANTSTIPATATAMASLSRFTRPREPAVNSPLAPVMALTSSLIKGVTVASDAEPFVARASAYRTVSVFTPTKMELLTELGENSVGRSLELAEDSRDIS